MPLRALVCDDDTPIRKMVCDILLKNAVEVVEAQNGKEALAILMKEKLDLVIVDFLMPQVDGLQVIRNLRLSSQYGKQIPVVLMSAISRHQIENEQKEFIPDYYINKPFKPKKMAKLLARILTKLKAKEKTRDDIARDNSTSRVTPNDSLDND